MRGMKLFVIKKFNRGSLIHLCFLLQTGMSGPILWLQNCLNRAADDREEDGNYK